MSVRRRLEQLELGTLVTVVLVATGGVKSAVSGGKLEQQLAPWLQRPARTRLEALGRRQLGHVGRARHKCASNSASGRFHTGRYG